MVLTNAAVACSILVKSTNAHLHRLAEAHAAVFREIPWGTYTVLQIIDAHPNGGGLEHQNSQVDEFTPDAVDAPGLSGLYSHEMFHSWNVKRLRPADLVPYRYDDAQPTGWLWVSEGITDYYSDLSTLRAGLDDSTAFLDNTANKMIQVAGAPPTAETDASLSPWVNPTDGSAGLYYPKGSLTGFLLDICIRDASDNHSSLDRVMRTLYTTTYAQHRGFTPTDWWGTVSRAAAGRSRAPKRAPGSLIHFQPCTTRWVQASRESKLMAASMVSTTTAPKNTIPERGSATPRARNWINAVTSATTRTSSIDQ